MSRGILVVSAAAVTLIGGCGGSSTNRTGGGSSSTRSVTLLLSGGSANQNATACSKQEAFEQYKAPVFVQFSGRVDPAPSGRWKVKLKVKRCNGSSFVDTNSAKIVGQPNGVFNGKLGFFQAGAYSIRARLEGDGRPQSEKVYLQVAGGK